MQYAPTKLLKVPVLIYLVSWPQYMHLSVPGSLNLISTLYALAFNMQQGLGQIAKHQLTKIQWNQL